LALAVEPAPLYGFYNYWEYYLVYAITLPWVCGTVMLIALYWYYPLWNKTDLLGLILLERTTI
jgi:hypothetical protein